MVPKDVHSKWVGLVCYVDIVALQVFLGDWSLDVALGSFTLRLKIYYHHHQIKRLLVRVSVSWGIQETKMWSVPQRWYREAEILEFLRLRGPWRNGIPVIPWW